VHPKPWDAAPRVLKRANATVISIDDVAGDWPLALTWAAQTALFVVTESADGCTLFLRGKPYRIPAPAVQEVDPRARETSSQQRCLSRYDAGLDPITACEFANCIAAQSVTRSGLDSLPTAADLKRCSTILPTWVAIEIPQQVGFLYKQQQ
jgi:sugar/nucleoside kinase (ribokinase family)